MENTMKETNPKTGVERRFSFKRFEAMMQANRTNWRGLMDDYGEDIKSRILKEEVSDHELYIICLSMDCDYRYCLMLRDDYVLSKKDPVKDPAAKEDRVDLPPVQKVDPSKTRERQYFCHMKRENNDIIKERFLEMFALSGMSFTAFSLFLGTTAKTPAAIMALKTLPKGMTANIAWLLETTPEYLTGKSNSPREGADEVIRPVMDNQTSLVKCETIKKHQETIRRKFRLSDDLLLWLTMEDRMVTRGFAERLAKECGVHRTALESKHTGYKAEPSLYLVTRSSALSDQLPNLLERQEEEQEEELLVADVTTSSKKSSSKAKAAASKKAAPVKATSAEADPAPAKKEPAVSVSSEKHIADLIDDMDDEMLDTLIEYTDTVRKMRRLRKKLS